MNNRLTIMRFFFLLPQMITRLLGFGHTCVLGAQADQGRRLKRHYEHFDDDLYTVDIRGNT